MGKKNPMADKAAEMFRAGTSMADIARSLDIPDSTVRRWKNTYKWETTKPNGERKKSERSDKADRAKAPKKDGTKQTIENEELNEQERLFCLYYVNSYNATMSYKKAYGCSYENANKNSYRMMVKEGIKNEIERLKEIRRQQVMASEEDIVELQMRIAFADMGDIAEKYGSSVTVKPFEEIDTRVIREVKSTKDGIGIKLEDRQKAISWLTKYFLMHPDDRYRAEFNRKRAEAGSSSMDELLGNMQTLADILRNPEENRTLEDLETEGQADE